MINLEMIFTDAVTTFFTPIADRAALELQELRPDIYQIAGKCFILRIRRGIGHRKDILITMAPLAASTRDLDDLTDEIGLGVIAAYYGVETPYQDISSVEGFRSSLQRLADTTEQLCIPYLLDRKSDYEEIRSFVARKIAAAPKPSFNFPPNVREEWL